MKQILLRKGRVTVEDVPAPAKHPKMLLVEVSKSLISTGTEISSLQQSGATLIEKVLKKPAAVGKVLHSIRVNGLNKTLSLIRQSLDQSGPLGYSCAGTVLSVGEEVRHFRSGDRVACAGTGHANHAEVVAIPENLAVKIPHGVSDRSAAFVALGAIALQGVRRADVKLGESALVIGLGLIGQLTVQLLAASGVRVFGLDVDLERIAVAKSHGLEDGAASYEELAQIVSHHTGGHGVDAALLTASTDSSDPAQKAFELTRKKGRVVVVGAVGLKLQRSPFYEKEQDFIISCSYGPGRYDSGYETEGQDYPYPYVRWTENRNMAGFLDLAAKGKINVEPLIAEEVSLDKAEEAYGRLKSTHASKPLAVVIAYDHSQLNFVKSTPVVQASSAVMTPGTVRVGLIGAGEFTKSTHIPNLQSLKGRFSIAGVATAHGSTAQAVARHLQAPLFTTDPHELIRDSKIDAVLIATRHNTHAALAAEALQAGKHVYLEKPMALNAGDLAVLEKVIRGLSSSPVFMVGFNRRWSPLVQKLKESLKSRKVPLVAIYRVNAGVLPPDHWTKTTEGGGRLRGEACHMVDLFRFLVQSPLKTAQVEAVSPTDQNPVRPDENFSANFTYEDGSLCSLVYTCLGSDELPKEKLEVHWEGKTAVLEDFRALQFMGAPGDLSLNRQDKGHRQALQTFGTAIQTGFSFPIPWDELVETTQACFQLDADVWGRMP